MTGDDLEDTIGGFVELEAELTSGGAAAGTYREGTVAGGSKVAVADVPDGYPAAFDTDHALRLGVETDDGATLAVYLPWPEAGSEADDVPRLLDNLGLAPDEFANVYGERVALEPVDGWHRVDVEGTTASTGDGWGVDGDSSGSASFDSDSSTPEYYDEDDTTVAAVVVPAIAVATGGLTWLVAASGGTDIVSSLVAVAWGLSMLAIPAALAYSAYVTSERGGWDPHPLVWGVAGVVPFLNVPAGIGYLLEWVARGKPRAGPSRLWLWGVVGAVLLSLGFLPVLLFGSGSSEVTGGPAFVGMTAWLYSIVLLPMAIFFDTRHIAEGGEWDPTRPVWIAGAVVASMGVFLGWFVGAVYLLKRNRELA